MRRSLIAASILAFTFVAGSSYAGVIATENARAGSGPWPVQSDGTAFGTGVVDAYPARWSIARGDRIDLKIRSTTSYAVRVFRLGWYGGTGSRQVWYASGYGADAQPYPRPESSYGLAEAGWHTSVSIATDSTWTPGLYVARVEQSGGRQGETFFVVRDDGARMPVLMVVSTNTHQAYNCWPGPRASGKSLYGFNSSSWIPTSSSLQQAVKVSYDRPFFVGGGTADVANQEYPFLRFLERNGWDVGYATDVDVASNPSILANRRAVIFVGHSEYWTRSGFDAVLAARDAGVNFLFATGDTISWQVRYESGAAGSTSTMVGYKESHSKDPEEIAGNHYRLAGDYATAKTHYRIVTKAWKSLAYYADLGIDERRPGMLMTGVQSAGIIRDASGAAKSDYPYADLEVTDSTHWIYAGTGMHYGDRIRNVMGYEVDSTLKSSTWIDPWRPPGQTRLGMIRQVADDVIKGASAYYRAGSGAEVVSFGAIYFSWALDDYAQQANVGGASSHDARAEIMVNNALRRWTGGTPMSLEKPAPEEGSGFELDPEVKETDPLVDEVPLPEQTQASEGGGCSFGGDATSTFGAALLVIGGALLVRRRRAARG